MAKVPFGRHEWRWLMVAGAVVVLLGVLATFQYRWIAGVTDAERERMRASVQVRAARMAEEFDNELARLYVGFFRPGSSVGSDPPKVCAERYAAWLAADREHAGLVRGFFVVQFATRPPQVLRIYPDRPPEPTTWPPDFGTLADELNLAAAKQTLPRTNDILLGGVPAFLIPLMTMTAPSPGRMNVNMGWEGFGVGWIDRSYLEREYLPALTRRHFAADGLDYDVAVVDPKANRLLYVSRPGLTRAAFAHPDVQAGLMQIRLQLVARQEGDRDHGGYFGPSDPNTGEWRLLVVHRAGSLDKAIASLRRRTLALSFAAVALVGVSVVFLVLSTRRAQRLARQQMEFVAGVSHELRTPLSVIRSAGENLSDGIVVEPEQVQHYGALIASEGRRLSEMVEQVMAFAGFNAGRDLSERSEADVDPVVEAAIAASRDLIGDNGFDLERRIPPGLPKVRANVPALTRALENLINNAVKYGGAGKWARVSAELAPEGHEIRITVEDRGMGIPPDEQRRVFEPFYRGRAVMGSAIRGSGLGLSLVRRIMEAHGGTVTVRSAPGEGSAFTLHLPCAKAGEPA